MGDETGRGSVVLGFEYGIDVDIARLAEGSDHLMNRGSYYGRA